MATRICENGHTFDKTSDCPVCPTCSKAEMENRQESDLPFIGAPAMRALESIGITKLNQLTDHTEKELLGLHGFGPKAIVILKEFLTKHGLSLAS